MEDVTFNKRKMKELEDNLLYKLSATKGTMLLISTWVMGPESGFLGTPFSAPSFVTIDVRKQLS